MADFFENFSANLSSIPFDFLVWIVWGSFGGLFVLTVILALCVSKVRAASKAPYLCLVNAYTGLTLAVFLITEEISGALFVAAAFWAVGYLSYGVLRFICRERAKLTPAPAQAAISAAPAVRQSSPPPAPVPAANRSPQPAQKPAEAPAARMNVRLEHAITVTDRLLQKDLGKTDRQELEKLKNTLTVLRVKGTLTPAEGEILNENFNTLLKLMAKYNV